MAVDVTDLGALEKSLNDAASKASVLWTTFVTFELYLAIAFGSVTHRDLLLETPIKLPILNVDLPLVAFFLVAPVVFVIFHFYVFLQLYGLAGKAREYDGLLKQQVRIDADRQRLRQRLDMFLILQFLAGPKEQRTHFQGFSLRLIAWVTLVGAPVLILLQAQIVFLPYHLEWTTWAQRLLLLIDIVVIWMFWNPVRSQDAPILGGILTPIWNGAGAVLTLCVLVFSACVATFPGEQVDDYRHKMLSEVASWPRLHNWLFAGAVDEASGKPESLFSNRLVLTDKGLVDADKIEQDEISRSFRGRNLRGAVLNRADLRKADFTGALLNDANLSSAKLQQARFGCAVSGEALTGTKKSDVVSRSTPRSERCASLQGAVLSGAQLQGALLNEAQLQGAQLNGAQLQGASLDWALLQGALFSSAQMQGASLVGAQLQGADLSWAELQGAALDGAKLQGASLAGAQLQGAFLDWAELHGATLVSAQLNGASLDSVGLQGALLVGAQLSRLSLIGAKVWRARGQTAFEFAMLDRLECMTKPWETLDFRDFQDWLNSVLSIIPEGTRKTFAKQQLTFLDPSAPEPDDVTWSNGDCPRQQEAKFQKHINHYLVDLACSALSPPHTARGLIRSGRIAATGAAIGMFADRLRKGRTDPTTCPGVRGFTDEDWTRLDKLTADTAGLVPPTSMTSGAAPPPRY